MLTTGTLEQMRREWQAHLEAIPFFAANGIVILVEDKLNLVESVKTILSVSAGANGRVGACVILETPAASPMSTTEFGPVMEKVTMSARVITHPEMNQGARGTNQSTSLIAEQVFAATIGFKPLTSTSPFMAAPNGYAPDRTEGLPVIDCLFQTSARLDTAIEPVSTPLISRNDQTGQISIICATSGAAIFYTLDGKKPVPRAGALGNFYTVPFTPAAGTLIRARAYLTGYFSSEAAQLQT
jgi:hypothetical protein